MDCVFGINYMQRPPDVYVTYDMPGVGCAAVAIGSIIGIALAYEPLMWVDQHTFPILGYIVYPVEWTLNKLLFPEAITPFRGNVGALLVGAICAAVIAVALFALTLCGIVIGFISIGCAEAFRAGRNVYWHFRYTRPAQRVAAAHFKTTRPANNGKAISQ